MTRGKRVILHLVTSLLAFGLLNFSGYAAPMPASGTIRNDVQPSAPGMSAMPPETRSNFRAVVTQDSVAVDGTAVDEIQAPKPELQIMRCELSDHERSCY